MATKNDWADIDDAGYWHKPEAEDYDSKKTAVTDEDIKPEPKPALVKLSEGQFVEPSMGYEYNKRFKVKVKVDFLDESARNMKKVNFSLYSIYMNKTESLSHNVDGYEDNGYAEVDMTLYYPPSYDEDKDTNVKYFFKATHERGDKVLDSEKLSMPQETHFVELKKDDYDENGAQKYNKSQEGDTFKANNVVKELQGNLITMGFLETGTDDGYFGDGTDAAIREFQDYAIKPERMKRKVGKTEKADKVLDQASDGIVCKNTADEIDTWLRKDWVKPIPVYRKGEYDDKGVSNGKGAKGTDDHHTGTPIVAAQEDLQKVGLYQEFSIDGWFHDHMYDALKQFQEAAKDGKFLINDVLTDIGEKLTGHREGILCPKTQKFLKAVVEKKGKVSNLNKTGLEIKAISLPNDNVSFTTKESENKIHVVAVISFKDIPKDNEKNIEWEIQSDPESQYKADIPKIDDIKGNDVNIIINIPNAINGRDWKPIKYQIRAKLNYQSQVYVSEWKKIVQDEKDMLRQQYIDMSKNKIPARSEFVNAGKSKYFTLTEGACNCGKHSYHLWSIMDKLDDVREKMGQSLVVNSGYRCPQKNTNTSGSAKESQHMYGAAADIGVRDFNADGKSDKDDWNTLKKKAEEADVSYIEPFDKTGTWVHMDWR
jgi:hypothetical protein